MLISFSFLCQLSGLPGEGEEWFGNSKLFLVLGGKCPASPPIPNLLDRTFCQPHFLLFLLGTARNQRRARPEHEARGLCAALRQLLPSGPSFCIIFFFFFFLKTRIFSCITTVQVNRFRELTIDAGLVSNIQSTFRFYQSSYKVIRIQIQDRVSLLPSNLEEFLSFGCCCCFVCFFIWLVVVVFVIHALRFFEKCRDPP